MTLLTICDACEQGDHDHHRRVVQAVPEGVIGGSTCRCDGECRDGRYKRADVALSEIAKLASGAPLLSEGR